jgi:hypothetical protein
MFGIASLPSLGEREPIPSLIFFSPVNKICLLPEVWSINEARRGRRERGRKRGREERKWAVGRLEMRERSEGGWEDEEREEGEEEGRIDGRRTRKNERREKRRVEFFKRKIYLVVIFSVEHSGFPNFWSFPWRHFDIFFDAKSFHHF